MRAVRLCSRIGRRRPEYSRIVLETAVPPLLERLVHASGPEAATGGGSAEGEVAEVTGVERACTALVELCELPDVFAVAVPALLAGEVVVLMYVCGVDIPFIWTGILFSALWKGVAERSGVTDSLR